MRKKWSWAQRWQMNNTFKKLKSFLLVSELIRLDFCQTINLYTSHMPCKGLLQLVVTTRCKQTKTKTFYLLLLNHSRYFNKRQFWYTKSTHSGTTAPWPAFFCELHCTTGKCHQKTFVGCHVICWKQNISLCDTCNARWQIKEPNTKDVLEPFKYQ